MGRSAAQRPSAAVGGPRSAAVVVVVLLIAAACQWRSLTITPDHRFAARPCAAGRANTFRIDPAGFTAAQLADMTVAVTYLRNVTGIPLALEIRPVPAGDRSGIVVRQGPIIQQVPGAPGGRVRHNGYSVPLDDDRDGRYDRGVVLLDDWNHRYPSRGGWGVDRQANFFKLAVHEFSHQVGLDDLYDDPSVAGLADDELMMRTDVAVPGPGDVEGWRHLGCPGGAFRVR